MIYVSFKSYTRSKSDVLLREINMQFGAYSYTDHAISSLSRTAVVDLSYREISYRSESMSTLKI